jgi:hypothetical protein
MDMTKSNPLFVDSTKVRGDLIGTQIELRKCQIFDDEQLYVLVTSTQGMTTRMQMKVLDYRSYEARVHLSHQAHVTFQFVIEKDGKILWLSAQHSARAQYAIVEEWEPLTDEVAIAAAQSLIDKPLNSLDHRSDSDGVAWARESSMNVRALMDKWGL